MMMECVCVCCYFTHVICFSVAAEHGSEEEEEDDDDEECVYGEEGSR